MYELQCWSTKAQRLYVLGIHVVYRVYGHGSRRPKFYGFLGLFNDKTEAAKVRNRLADCGLTKINIAVVDHKTHI